MISGVQRVDERVLRKSGGSEHGVTWMDGSKVFRKVDSQDLVNGGSGDGVGGGR